MSQRYKCLYHLEPDTLCAWCTGVVEHLETENAKLREALEHITGSWKDYDCCSDAIDGDYLADHLIELADKALAEVEKDFNPSVKDKNEGERK